MTLSTPLPSTASITRPTSTVGSEIWMSTSRISAASHQPRAQAAERPSTAPMAIAAPVATKATVSDRRSP